MEFSDCICGGSVDPEGDCVDLVAEDVTTASAAREKFRWTDAGKAR